MPDEIVLSVAGTEQLLDALQNPPEPSERMVEAARRHKEMVETGQLETDLKWAFVACEMCGRSDDLEEHHIRHKQMGGRKGQAKIDIEKPENKEILCRVCHGAKHHIRVILADGFNCDACYSQCEHAQLAHKERAH